jgi:hypothetical protein
MMMPMILKLRVKDKEGKNFFIWLPLFLVWIIIFPLLLIPIPFVALAALIMWPSGKGFIIFHGYLTIFKIIGCLSGLEIDIESRNSTFFIILK